MNNNKAFEESKNLLYSCFAAWSLCFIIFLVLGENYPSVRIALAAVKLLIAVFAMYIMYFFRDPERHASKDEKDIVSPADGVVVAIEELDETQFTQKKMKRIAIFLNVFNVHINRAPYLGKISKLQHYPGKFLDARHPQCSVENESQSWLIEHNGFSLVIRQVAGLIARRICVWKNEGDEVQKGERIGMIKFGSRTELYIPMDCEVTVK
ncbi:MAG: phosphatidylserine decarboxylase family protein, partial [Verrucomicrobiota bacterium]|nr:phosphatidylserine decarboxylase family protein [Verrucomicrobiota bacterium]